MASWGELVAAEPAFAATVRAYFDLGAHKTLATLRRDGAPRISAIETIFVADELWFGSMPDARKATDLARDPRFALHGPSADASSWTGDAKLAGRAEEITDTARIAEVFAAAGHTPQGPSHLFRADIDEVSTVRVGEPRDHLVIESWRPARGLRRIERR